MNAKMIFTWFIHMIVIVFIRRDWIICLPEPNEEEKKATEQMWNNDLLQHKKPFFSTFPEQKQNKLNGYI